MKRKTGNLIVTQHFFVLSVALASALLTLTHCGNTPNAPQNQSGTETGGTPPSSSDSSGTTGGSATGGSSPTLSASAQAGKIVYDMKCAGCHRLGTYDTVGNRDLKGKADNVNPMILRAPPFNVVISDQEVIDVKNFIRAY